MLSREDNELLCRVGPGTAMGTLLRQYWVPAALSSELPEPEGSPLRVRLLGESLVAYRTASGAVGLMQSNCPHRGASMFYGRNEGEGLRCVYHGWKFGPDGRCMDMPSEPAETDFKRKVRATAYPCVERGGLVWAYMGPRETAPPMPELEATMVEEKVSIQAYQRECNWIQALEGDIDTGHTVFLHLGGVDPDDVPAGTWAKYVLTDPAAHYEVTDTDFGVMYGARRRAEADTDYWRIANFLFPFYTMVPTGVLGLEIRMRAWVPMDDDHTMFITVTSGSAPAPRQAGRQAIAPPELLPNTTDWYGRFRLAADGRNDYLIDRKLQKTVSYTGIGSIHAQDQAVTESMGPIYDRTQEHLGTSDRMVIRTRKRLLDAAKALRDSGKTPPGVDDPKAYAVRSGGVVLPRGADWIEATRDLRRAWVKHPGLSRSVLGGVPAV